MNRLNSLPVTHIKFYNQSNNQKLIDTNMIVLIEGDGPYSTVYLTSGGSFTMARTLKSIHEPHTSHFIRISKGILVNPNHIIKIDLINREVVLSNAQKFEVSRRRIWQLRGISFGKDII